MSEKPEVRHSFDASEIPEELKALPRWLLWKHVWIAKEKRWNKVPFQINGRYADSTDPSTWGTFEDVCRAYNDLTGFDGTGFVFNGDGITGIDVDKAIDEKGNLSEKARRILESVEGYAERSPSGTGFHIITRANTRNIKKDGVEIYGEDRFFTFTGAQLNGHNLIPSAEQNLDAFHAIAWPDKPISAPSEKHALDEATVRPPLPRTIEQMRQTLQFIETPDDEPSATELIWAIHHQTNGSEEGLALAHDACSGEVRSEPVHSKYDFDYVEERWKRSDDQKGNLKTWRSIEREAKANGWSGLSEAEEVIAQQKPLETGFVQAAAFASSIKEEWLIKKIIPKNEMTVLYGDPGSSKSFFVLDLAMHIARGLDWRNFRTKRATVAYIAAEGVSGFSKRLQAYAKGHGIDLASIPFYVRGGSFKLVEQCLATVEEMKKIGASLVVIDTLAAVTPGANENTSEDMGQALFCASLMQAAGITVILVHHTNKTGDVRGWSGVRGNTTSMVRIERKEDARTAHIEKQKDEQDGGAFGYRLRVIDLGSDEDGDPVTSCIVVPDSEIAPNTRTAKKERKPRSGDFETSANYHTARMYRHVLRNEFGMDDEASISIEDFVSLLNADETLNPMKREDFPRPDNVQKTLLTLQKYKQIAIESGRIRLCENSLSLPEPTP